MNHPNDAVLETSVEEMQRLFLINVCGVLSVTQQFYPLLVRAAQQKEAAVVNMSSYLGSIELNETGGTTAYRVSKSALNSLTKNLALRAKEDGIVVVALHPGWLATDMGCSGNRSPPCTRRRQPDAEHSEGNQHGTHRNVSTI